MNTEIQHNKAAAVEQHMLAILDIVHAEDTTDSMRRWIADELRDLAGTISRTALARKPVTDPTAARPIDLSDDEYDRRGIEDAARLREMRGDPNVPHRRKSGRIDWRYPKGHVRGTATLSFTKRPLRPPTGLCPCGSRNIALLSGASVLDEDASIECYDCGRETALRDLAPQARADIAAYEYRTP